MNRDGDTTMKKLKIKQTGLPVVSGLLYEVGFSFLRGSGSMERAKKKKTAV